MVLRGLSRADEPAVLPIVTAAAPTLNERQRAYLLAIFETDQAVEADIRSIPYRPFQPRPKASEWRWLEYSEAVPEIGKPASRLYVAIEKSAPIDQGTGATFAALADRRLVEVRWGAYNVHGQRKPDLRLTAAGRRLARSWTGVKAFKAPPAGTLKEWHWRALAKAYAAGAAGVAGGEGVGWSTWLRLLDYKWGALVEEARRAPQPGEYSASGTIHLIRITSAGLALYEREWARYRELYPAVVEALEPSAAAAGEPETAR
jgi:hypothetical protein